MPQGKSWERMLQGSAYQIKSKNKKNYTAHSRNLKMGNKSTMLFLKKPLWMGDLPPMHKIFIKRSVHQWEFDLSRLAKPWITPAVEKSFTTKNKILKNYKKEWHISEKWTSS